MTDRQAACSGNDGRGRAALYAMLALLSFRARTSRRGKRWRREKREERKKCMRCSPAWRQRVCHMRQYARHNGFSSTWLSTVTLTMAERQREEKKSEGGEREKRCPPPHSTVHRSPSSLSPSFLRCPSLGVFACLPIVCCWHCRPSLRRSAFVAAESPPVCLVSAIAALSLLFLSLSMVRAGAPLPVCL